MSVCAFLSSHFSLFGACCQRGRMRRGYKKILTFCFSSACLEDQQELHVLFLQLRISSVSCELRVAKTLFFNKFICTLFIF